MTLDYNCLTSTSCLLLLLLYAARTMNHMMREIRRKVAGTAVTRIEANNMPCGGHGVMDLLSFAKLLFTLKYK